MTEKIGIRLIKSIVTASLIVFALSIFPISIGAQTAGDGSYRMFGVNLVGTLPMMNKTGQSITSGDLLTLDAKMSLKIPLGTIIHNAAGKNQEFISATMVPNPTSLPTQQKCIIAYELGTPGASFNPTVGLSFSYSDAELPTSVSESSLYIAQWNGSSWIKIPSDINTSLNIVSTTISSFTAYALLVTNVPTTVPVTTTAPVPTITTSQTTTASPVPTSSDSSNQGSSSVSPILFVVGGGAVLLLILLVVISRKR
jgi:hypothetical protein